MIRLPADVCGEVSELRAVGKNNYEVVEVGMKNPNEYPAIARIMKHDMYTFMSALENGYDEKLSPEAEILNYYKEAKNDYWDAVDRSSDDEDAYETNKEADIAEAKIRAVEFVLFELGIKIEGIGN